MLHGGRAARLLRLTSLQDMLLAAARCASHLTRQKHVTPVTKPRLAQRASCGGVLSEFYSFNHSFTLSNPQIRCVAADVLWQPSSESYPGIFSTMCMNALQAATLP